MKKSRNTLLIAGTQIGAGKTTLGRVLDAYLSTYYPACDRTSLSLSDASLSAAAAAHGGLPSTDLAALWQSLTTHQAQHDVVLLEAPGSLGSPLTPETTVADLAWDWRLPTVLVVPMLPDAIGQAIAHVALARQSRVLLKGLVLNLPQPTALSETEVDALLPGLRSLTQVPVLGTIPYIEPNSGPEVLAAIGSRLNIEGVLPLPLPRLAQGAIAQP